MNILNFFNMIYPKNAMKDRMISESAKNNALDVIEKHGLEAHFYFPGIGNRNDEELSNALDLLSSLGFIITDSSGNIVGKAAKKRLSSQEKADSRRSAFKIVESK